jgi:hypothetical protein
LWAGTNPTPATKIDTGIVAVGSTYQTIDILRTSGVITMLINGSQVATASPSPYNIDTVYPAINISASTSGTTTGYFDYFKAWSRTAR